MSNCCGAEPSFISDEICGDCLEHAEFDEDDEQISRCTNDNRERAVQ